MVDDALVMENTSEPSVGGRIVPITITPLKPVSTASGRAMLSSTVPLPLPELRSTPSVTDSGAFTIDCADCAHRNTAVCDDCIVSFIVDREPDDALVVDADEARAVRLLEQAGLVPGVRHSQQVG